MDYICCDRLIKSLYTVDHHLLLQDIRSLQLNSYTKSFLCAYSSGRLTSVEFRGSRPNYRFIKQGVPQGGVLSPVQYNLYMSSMPNPPANILLLSYADNSNVLGCSHLIVPVVIDLNVYLSVLDNLFKSHNLFISPSKSSATVKKYHLSYNPNFLGSHMMICCVSTNMLKT